MERIQAINPDRIRWCCNDLGVTREQLASDLNIPLSSMARVLNDDNDEDGLTFPQLRKVAAYFGRGVLFFLEEGPVDAAAVHTPQFRTLANEKPSISPKLRALIERVERQRDIYLSLREELEEPSKPWSPPPALSRQDPIGAARIAREWLGLGLAAQNSFDKYRAAVETQGALVFLTNGYNGKWQIARENPILGFSLYDAMCPVIVIKKQRWEPQQCFTLMHELGHLLLHKTSSIDDEQDFQSSAGASETEANSFAGRVLVPDEVLNSIRNAERPADAAQFDDWLSEPRRQLGVSGEVILRRLLDAGHLPSAQYAAYRQWRSQDQSAVADEPGSRTYRHREPLHIFGVPFVKTVFDALGARRITLTRASSYLDDLKIDDLHLLERHAGI